MGERHFHVLLSMQIRENKKGKPWPHSQAIGKTAWELPQVQTVYRCNVTAIAISHSSSAYQISACDTIFQLWEHGFLATGCCRFYYWSAQSSSCRVLILVRSSNRYWNEMGVTVTFQCMTQLGFTVVTWQHSETWLVLPTFCQWK